MYLKYPWNQIIWKFVLKCSILNFEKDKTIKFEHIFFHLTGPFLEYLLEIHVNYFDYMQCSIQITLMYVLDEIILTKRAFLPSTMYHPHAQICFCFFWIFPSSIRNLCRHKLDMNFNVNIFLFSKSKT